MAYSPLTFQSFGFPNEQQFLKGYGVNYGYVGPYNYNTRTPVGYEANGQVYKSQDYYNQLQDVLSGRAGFLDQQLKGNPQAYNEYAAKPYAFSGSDPFKTSAQKAAEAEAARQTALLKTTGGTTTATGTTQIQPGGQAGQTTSIANLAPLPIPTAAQLPDYIPPNNNALIGELKKLLGNIPGLFNTRGITNAFKNRSTIDEAFGQQAASNAAATFANQQVTQGGDASLAGLVRAQALLPVLQHTSQIQSELADKKLQSRQAQGNLSANVAEALGNLRTNYLKGLIDYTGKIQDIQSTNQLSTQKLNEQSREFDLGNQLDKLRVGLQERQVSSGEKSDKLRALLALADLRKQTIDPRVQNYYGQGPAPIDPYRQDQNDQLQQLLQSIGALT